MNVLLLKLGIEGGMRQLLRSTAHQTKGVAEDGGYACPQLRGSKFLGAQANLVYP